LIVCDNRKKKPTTPHCQFQTPINDRLEEARSSTQKHKYMTVHFPGLVQALIWSL